MGVGPSEIVIDHFVEVSGEALKRLFFNLSVGLACAPSL